MSDFFYAYDTLYCHSNDFYLRTAEDIEAIDKAMNELNTIFQAASQEMYNQEAQGGQGANFQDADINNPYSNQQEDSDEKKSDDDDVQDVDYEEVK